MGMALELQTIAHSSACSLFFVNQVLLGHSCASSFRSCLWLPFVLHESWVVATNTIQTAKPIWPFTKTSTNLHWSHNLPKSENEKKNTWKKIMMEIVHRVRIQGSVLKHKYKADYFRVNKKVKTRTGAPRGIFVSIATLSQSLYKFLSLLSDSTPLRAFNTPRDMTFPAWDALRQS